MTILSKLQNTGREESKQSHETKEGYQQETKEKSSAEKQRPSKKYRAYDVDGTIYHKYLEQTVAIYNKDNKEIYKGQTLSDERLSSYRKKCAEICHDEIDEKMDRVVSVGGKSKVIKSARNLLAKVMLAADNGDETLIHSTQGLKGQLEVIKLLIDQALSLQIDCSNFKNATLFVHDATLNNVKLKYAWNQKAKETTLKSWIDNDVPGTVQFLCTGTEDWTARIKTLEGEIKEISINDELAQLLTPLKEKAKKSTLSEEDYAAVRAQLKKQGHVLRKTNPPNDPVIVKGQTLYELLLQQNIITLPKDNNDVAVAEMHAAYAKVSVDHVTFGGNIDPGKANFRIATECVFPQLKNQREFLEIFEDDAQIAYTAMSEGCTTHLILDQATIDLVTIDFPNAVKCPHYDTLDLALSHSLAPDKKNLNKPNNENGSKRKESNGSNSGNTVLNASNNPFSFHGSTANSSSNKANADSEKGATQPLLPNKQKQGKSNQSLVVDEDTSCAKRCVLL